MSRVQAGHCADAESGGANPGHEAPTLLADFDVTTWARAACEASGVPFAVEDPVTLAKLRDLVEHPA